METFECDLWLPLPIEKVWDFLSRPANLAALTPPSYGAKIEGPEQVHEGATAIAHLNPWGLSLPIHWVSKIHDVQTEGPRRAFTDIQASGPMAHWKHVHLVEAGSKNFEGKRSEKPIKISDGGTWILDRIEYALPLGVLGQVAHSLFGLRQLEKFFAYRHQKLKEILCPTADVGISTPTDTPKP